ncbi:rubrerythrin family protein [Lachnospiraceae bacterium]|nr:rubrerythrin family protein [Lachnospiraceae bacterium]
MAMDFKQSETMKNLMRAFAGESQARNRYTFAAAQANSQGLYVIEHIFKFTADQEKEHAEVFYNQLKELAGETIHIDGGYPVDLSPNISDLLDKAQHNEYEEHDDVYKNFADKAQEEGFGKAAAKFRLIAEIEKLHGDRFGAFAQLLKDNQLFVSKVETKWMCLNCGHVQEGTEAPQKCPVCDHEQGWFIRMELAPYCRDGNFEKFPS